MNHLLRNLLIIMLCMCFCIPVVAISPVDTETISLSTGTDYDILPVNEAGNVVFYKTIKEFAASLTESMINRENLVTIGFSSSTQIDGSFYSQVDDLLFAHSSDPAGGDYLHYHFASYDTSASVYVKGGVYYYTFTFVVDYYTSAAEEAELDAAVKTLVSDINSSCVTDYEKVKAIYDYICKNVVYDYDNLNDPLYSSKYSAYAAMIMGTAVCQGYANLFQRLAMECGIDSRIVCGKGNNADHAWNIVRLNGVYYNVDATWDSTRAQAGMKYEYFLRSNENFTGHVADSNFTEAPFVNDYPISDKDYTASSSHKVNDTWYIDSYATSEHAGEKSHHCSICGVHLDVTEIEYVNSANIYKNYEEHGWSKDGINFVSSNGLMGDTGNGSFAQTGTMTRSMFVTVLWRIAGKPTPTGKNVFTDLDPNQTWYHDAVIWANENGIVNGTSATTFSPNGEVTREQIATLLYRYDQNFLKHNIDVKDDVLSAYPDLGSVSSYASAGLAWANTVGLIKGQTGSNGTSILAPKNNATREEVAVIISRFCLH